MRTQLKRFLERLRPPLTLSSVDAYARWAVNYPPLPHNRLMEIEQGAMMAMMPPLEGKRVLDLACGTGRYGLIAQRAGARIVYGIDNSAPMLIHGALNPVGVGEMAALPFPKNTFDVVICGMALGHLPRPRMHQAIREIARVLSPQGNVLFSDFHPYLYEMGGRRRFTVNGKSYNVEHYIYFVSEYFAVMRNSFMIMEALEEPRTTLGDNEVPAVLVIRGRKVNPDEFPAMGQG